MKRILLPLLALSAFGFTAGSVLAADPAPAPAPQKLVKVATIRGADAVREFERNVQLVQAQRSAAIQIQDQMAKEKDAKKKAELKNELDAMVKKLNENNAKMIKAYGFSLTRNYTMEIDQASIYMQVSDAEAAKLEAEQAKK